MLSPIFFDSIVPPIAFSRDFQSYFGKFNRITSVSRCKPDGIVSEKFVYGAQIIPLS